MPTPGGAPLSIRTTEYDLSREGIVTALTWTGGDHEVKGGVWYETNDFNQARRFYGEPSRRRADALVRRLPDAIRSAPNGSTTSTPRPSCSICRTRWSLGDAVRFNFGFRSVSVENEATTVVGDVKTGTIEADEPFLPQIGVNWAFSDDVEVFTSVGEEHPRVREQRHVGSVQHDGRRIRGDPRRREARDSDELRGRLAVSRAATRSKGSSRSITSTSRIACSAFTQGPGIVGNPAVLANVGSVNTEGVEGGAELAADDELHAGSRRSHGTTPSTTTITRSKQQRVCRPSCPWPASKSRIRRKCCSSPQVGYDNGAFFVRADVNYTDERFYTYLNDGGVDAYTLLNIGAGYRFTSLGAIEELVMQADVTNVTDKEYFSTIDSNGFVNSDPNGTAQTLLRGAPRQFFLSLKARF